jgi:hypothetical protein
MQSYPEIDKASWFTVEVARVKLVSPTHPAITRMRCHPQTRAYEARCPLQGKTHRDIRRCLKRSIARRLYRIMESSASARPTLAGA